jgi:hypothetical protein
MIRGQGNRSVTTILGILVTCSTLGFSWRSMEGNQVTAVPEEPF